MPRKILLIVNRRARHGGDKIAKAVEFLDGFSVAIREEDATEGGDLVRRIQSHLGEVDAVVVAGGDGTINSALGALVHRDTPLGIVPLGTANNLARTLEIPLDVKSACELVATGEPKSIDVGMVNDHYFLTTASLGLSVRITHELSGETKHRWGRIAYIIAAGRALRGARPFEAELRLKQKNIRTHTVQIVVGNGLYYGTKLRVADDAEIDDHALDVLSVEVSRWWELLRVFPSLKKGDHAKRDDILSLRTRELEINTKAPRKIDVDGELITSTPATFRVLPKALKVLTPAPAG